MGFFERVVYRVLIYIYRQEGALSGAGVCFS